MAIELNDGARIGAPVIRQQRLGEVAYLAVVRTEQRDRLRRNQCSGEMEPIPNGTDRKGRPRFRQEMVIHALALPGTPWRPAWARQHHQANGAAASTGLIRPDFLQLLRPPVSAGGSWLLHPCAILSARSSPQPLSLLPSPMK
jgi:hypothetical protein